MSLGFVFASSVTMNIALFTLENNSQRACVRACVRVCVRACALVQVCICACARRCVYVRFGVVLLVQMG